MICIVLFRHAFLFLYTYIVVANKVDLPNREVDLKQAEEYADMHNMIYVEASAKTGKGIYDVFRLLVHQIRSRVRCKFNFVYAGGRGLLKYENQTIYSC